MARGDAVSAPRRGGVIPDSEEWRAARTWLLPWATERGWWHAPAALAAVLAAVRALVLLVSHRPWFMNDSAEYLLLVDDLYVPRTRPPGVALLWRAALAVWTSFDAILLAQALLGVVTGVLVYCVAREARLGQRAALTVGLVASLTPTVLFFERVLLTETLALFLVVLTSWLMLVAIRTGSTATWAITGLVAALSVLVRTVALLAVPVIAVVALLITRGSLLRRLAAVTAFGLATSLPLGGYAFATYVDTRAITGSGHFGLQFTDGFAYFVATAPLTDCTRPDRPPAIRGRVCAVDGYLDRDPDAISWGPGPVYDALRSEDYIEYNRQLRALALENIRRSPLGFLDLVRWRTARMLSTYDNEYHTDGRPFADQLTRLGLPVTRGDDGLQDVWPVLVDGWVLMRLALWAALVVALVMTPPRWARGGREVAALGAVPVVSFVWLCVSATPVARYLLLFEPTAWIAAAWLLVTVREDRRAGALEATPTMPVREAVTA